MFVNFVVAFFSICSVFARAEVPEQVHLALGRSLDTMAVQWATMDTFCTTQTLVQYGIDPNNLTQQVAGNCFEFSLIGMLKQSNHLAYMTGLSASTKYYYRVGDAKDWSPVFFFTSSPEARDVSPEKPQKFLVFGDLSSSKSGPTNSETVMPYTTKEVTDGNVDVILALGDFAYNFASEFGRIGRLFMNEIQNMTAFAPMMVNHGNHEAAYNFAHYTEFFRNQPSNLVDTEVTTLAGKAPNNWYYSYDVGLVHVITLSSEIYFLGYDHANVVTDMPRKQYEWFENDLKAAQANRANVPWIIVNSHRSIYCSCDGDCDDQALTLRSGILFPDGTRKYGLEKLLYSYGVDLYLNGHEHNYERMYDIAPAEDGTWLAGKTTQTTHNPPGTIYAVIGNAGNQEDHEVFSREQPDRTAYRTDSYGYVRLTVHNSSHLYWEEVQCDSSETPVILDKVMDSAWIVQENHGPFADNYKK